MKVKSVFLILLTMLFICLGSTNYVYAHGATLGGSFVRDLVTEMGKGLENNQDNGKAVKDSRVMLILAKAFKLVQYIGTGISIIAVLWLGISYMISSVDQKAEIKKKAFPILIGSVLIVSTVTIMGFISHLIKEAVNDTSLGDDIN